MPPANLARIFFGEVLGLMDQEVDIRQEEDHARVIPNQRMVARQRGRAHVA